MSPPTNNWRYGRSEHNVNKTRALLQTTGDKEEVNMRALVLFTLCSLRLYLQLFVGGLMSYLRYVRFVFISSFLSEGSCLIYATFGSTLPPVVCRRALQTTGGKDDVNIT
jgi:hypothetical protein